MAHELFTYLSEGMGDPRDPQTKAETEVEWLALGCPATLRELLQTIGGEDAARQ